MNTRTLDRTKKFSTVHGEIETGACFYQGGLPFDSFGKLLDASKLNDAERATLAKAKPVSKPAAKAKSPRVPDAPAVHTADDGTVNLTAWLKGEEKYKPFAILAAVKKRTGVASPNLVEAARLLVFEQKIVPEAECRVKLA